MENQSNPDASKHGRWLILKPGTKKGYVICRCDCGAEREVRRAHLTSGASTSCGCFARQECSKRSETHGMSRSRLWGIWSNMRNRCNRPNLECYHRYGGRGIKVCPEWGKSFVAFKDWAESNGYADDLTIDRINNDGDYCPENCRWADKVTQAQNRRETIMLKDGRIGYLVAAENGINGEAFRARVRLGWSAEDAATRSLRNTG